MRKLAVSIANVALTGLLCVSLVGVTTSVVEYDPWADVNNDGFIDIFDIVRVALRFNTEGEPFEAKAGCEYDSGWINITDDAGQYISIVHDLGIADWDNLNITVDIIGRTVPGGGLLRYLGTSSFTSTWSRIYESGLSDWQGAMVQTTDGGYLLAGCHAWPTITDYYEFWLVKTDAFGEVEWDRNHGGAYGDFAEDVIQTSDDGYAVTGWTNASGSTGIDFGLVKTAANGDLEWQRTYGGTGVEVAKSVIQTSDGDYALAGYSESFSVHSDAWLVKVDKEGYVEWTRNYGGVLDDEAYDLVQTGDGGYALAGETESYGLGPSDAWLVKTDAAGNHEWNVTYEGKDRDGARALILTSDGGFALAGYYESGSQDDYWLGKADAGGHLEWSHTYGGTENDIAQSVVQTPDGGYALVGCARSLGDLAGDFWLVKTDRHGHRQWSQKYGGAFNDEAKSIVLTSDGCYAMAGWTASFGAIDLYLVKTLGELTGLMWTDASTNTITLFRGPDDQAWNYVRVRIWMTDDTA
jgi:hypothetical protein